eukprot:scaffold20328_cov116-Isochrysis_galbana.AAC.1
MTQATLQRCPRELHLAGVLLRICVDRDHADAQDLGAVGEARWGRGVRVVCKDTTAPDGSLQVQREECCRLKHHDRSSARLSFCDAECRLGKFSRADSSRMSFT